MNKLSEDKSQFARHAWMGALKRVAAIEQDPHGILPVIIERLADTRENAPALVSTEAAFSYRELARLSNRYAHWGLSQGLKPGDSVSLIMSNCAEYLAIWLGLTRIGTIVALANYRLAGELLAHAVNIVAPKLVIVGALQAPSLVAARSLLPSGLKCFATGAACEDVLPIEHTLAEHSPDHLPPSMCAVPPLESTALYIYTSGTTGLPKAAKVSHRRLMQWSYWFAGLLNTGPEDRMYDCLPLYHSVGGVVATGATLMGGGTVVIREQFSASNFWRDIRDERCTLFQYIGELCRYLVNTAPDPVENEHSLRIACGNGLRIDVWNTFQSRFRIPRIVEYYAATEGSFSLYNCEGEPGAIGRIPPYLRNQLQVELLRFDVDSGEPLREADGFCRRCEIGEVGEAVGKGRFEGYADAAASERKILRDVFKPGDTWYRTGDLMRIDERGFYYFVDRVGDTYRWKGENVSTSEVISVLTTTPGVLDAAVYGVTVPGADGRAGMAALIVQPDFDVARFRALVAGRLPSYARPLFLRVLPRLETTSTFKIMNRDLMLAGFDPSLVSDSLFVDSPAAHAYVPLDLAAFSAIASGKLKL